MYYKKQRNEPPIVRTGCVYAESYFYNGYLYLKFAVNNIPSEELTEITQEEYEANKPVIPEPELEQTETELLMQANTDSELRDLEIQQNQELLAQQLTDIEVALLGGGR
ncbi:hypothetical protein [Anaerotignum propionicum]|uniref:hypothetical protein n=1 Tax=Anaerotignum propionicum TaxID=28446 RepID=UPI00289AAF7C|nr:hypothetical protein [Anaerotignum propionicum]